jgi:hypothetical protein
MLCILFTLRSSDNSFKLIFDNPQLFAEFLRDFVPIDLLKHLSPDDITDHNTRHLPLFQENRDSDTVKRIRLKDGSPLFVIAIIEHESEVNFRSSFKLLQYICLILDEYEKEAEQQNPGIAKTKDFRYPPVLPIVFYDGSSPWTAETNFRNRTYLNEVFAKYIPGFEYELVDLRRYKSEEIMRFNDTLSMVMLLDRLGMAGGKDYSETMLRTCAGIKCYAFYSNCLCNKEIT